LPSSFFQGVTVLGYCMTPLVLACIVLRAASFVVEHTALRVFVVSIGFAWAVYGAGAVCGQG
jgi:hypothetical protein